MIGVLSGWCESCDSMLTSVESQIDKLNDDKVCAANISRSKLFYLNIFFNLFSLTQYKSLIIYLV